MAITALIPRLFQPFFLGRVEVGGNQFGPVEDHIHGVVDHLQREVAPSPPLRSRGPEWRASSRFREYWSAPALSST